MTKARQPEGLSLCSAPTTCHPERSLAKRKAIRQTEPDPYHLDTTAGDAGNFRILIRFFDDHDTEVVHEPGREAAPQEGPARQCRVITMYTTESRTDAIPA